MPLLEHVFARFVAVLRQAGVRVSSAETLEALKALEMVNIMDRHMVKSALKATLIKTPDLVSTFDRAFDLFFTPPEEKEKQLQEAAQARELAEKIVEEARQELTFQGESLELSPEEHYFYGHLDTAKKAKLQEFLQKSSEGKNVNKEKHKPLIEELVRGQLNYWRRHTPTPPNTLPLSPTGDNEIDMILEQLNGEAGEQSQGVMHRNMTEFSREEIPKVHRVIRRMSKNLATRISRRYRLSKKLEKMDLRRSIRHNIRYGGTLLQLKYRTKRVQKPQLILICDVSGSMIRYSNFVLQFVHGLSSVVKDIKCYMFSENMERMPEFSIINHSVDDIFNKMTQESQVWGKGTNLRRSLENFLVDHKPVLNHKSVIILVSDTKTLEAAEAAAILQTMRRKVKEIIWLNTLPRKDWERFQTVSVFQKCTTMFQCNTLADLEQVMTRRFLQVR